MRILDFAEQALRDLNGIQEWQAQPGSGPAARRRMATILRASRALQDFPCRYPNGTFTGTRQMTVERHVVIYKVTPDTGDNRTAGDVLVVRVFGPAQRRDRL